MCSVNTGKCWNNGNTSTKCVEKRGVPKNTLNIYVAGDECFKKINVVNFRGKYLDARFLSIPDRKCRPEDEDKNENKNRKRRPKLNPSY